MPNSRFKIQDASIKKSLPEKQGITILHCRVSALETLRLFRGSYRDGQERAVDEEIVLESAHTRRDIWQAPLK
jgi:hypothetical protein